MKLIISISCVLALVLLNTCQAKDETKISPDVVEIEKEMERGLEVAMEMSEMIRGLDAILGPIGKKPIGEPAGNPDIFMIIEFSMGYPNNSTGVVNGDKGGAKEYNGTEHKEVPISMMDDDKTGDQTEHKVVAESKMTTQVTISDDEEGDDEHEGSGVDDQNTTIETVSESLKDIEYAIALEEAIEDVHEVIENTKIESMNSEIKDVESEIAFEEYNEEINYEIENIEIEGMNSEIMDVEKEIALDEDNEEFNEEIENMNIEGINSEIKGLHQEEDNLMEEIDILENSFIEKNYAPAVHSANHATQDDEEQQAYSQSTMRLVYFISAGILMLSVLLLLIVLVMILTKKEAVHGNLATGYVKRIRLISNASSMSKEPLV